MGAVHEGGRNDESHTKLTTHCVSRVHSVEKALKVPDVVMTGASATDAGEASPRVPASAIGRTPNSSLVRRKTVSTGLATAAPLSFDVSVPTSASCTHHTRFESQPHGLPSC